MNQTFPWEADDIPWHVAEAAKLAASSSQTFSHHMAKAAVERWLAFELAAVFDEQLRDAGWTALVESGATAGVGNIDVLLVPQTATTPSSRLRPRTDQWHEEAVAIELKAAHLGDGDNGYRTAMLDDLTRKPELAHRSGRSCARWVGLLVTTDGLWPGSPNAENTRRRGEELRLRQLRPAPPLVLVASETLSCRYRDWSGTVWFDAMQAYSGPVPPKDEIDVPVPAANAISDILDYALQGRTGMLNGDYWARAHLGISAGELHMAREEHFNRTGEWVGTYEELQVCLYQEQRGWHIQNEPPRGKDADKIVALAEAIRRRQMVV